MVNKINPRNIVFVLMAIASIGLAFVKIMDIKDFGVLASLVIGSYFGGALPEQRASNTQNDITPTE
jgi:hypothetical protein